MTVIVFLMGTHKKQSSCLWFCNIQILATFGLLAKHLKLAEADVSFEYNKVVTVEEVTFLQFHLWLNKENRFLFIKNWFGGR